ncbi:MAG TPA: hypothetical protein VK464_08630 [Symbiobacteriaceae bacterium]|jgi:hypothetical protein|nr:hypothetical protein [Symbiobacteriaceae bacterium]
MEMGAIVGYTTLAILALALAVPNYLAIRYAMFSGAAAAGGAGVAAMPVAKAQKVSRLGEFGFMWKALSPILFAVGFIIGLGVGGPVGTGMILLTLLNLVLGFIGWGSYIPGKMGKR